MKPKVALAWQLIPCTLPKLSHLSWLAALIAFGTAPVALGHPISPTPFHPLQDICWLRQAEGAGEAGEITVLRSQGGEEDSSLSEPHCSPIHQKVSTSAADLVLAGPDRPPFPLVAEKLTETAPSPQPGLNPVPEGKQPSDTLEQAAKDAENPLTDRISIPIINRTAFGIGPFERSANVTNIAPVLPISLGEKNYLVVRPTFPFIYSPTLSQPQGGDYGLGDISMQTYFIPKPTGRLTWGFGPTFLFPTASQRTLGFGKWGIGPALAAVWEGDRLTFGGQIRNYWSVAGDEGRADVSQFTFQPFVTYVLSDGWYLTSAPNITAFWNLPGEKWVIPIGGGLGKLMKLGDRPLSVSIQAYWQPIRPLNSEGWALVISLQSLFPR